MQAFMLSGSSEKAIQKQTMTFRILREITDSHFTENHQMESKLGLRFISKIDQR
jgi:hypothetical protein